MGVDKGFSQEPLHGPCWLETNFTGHTSDEVQPKVLMWFKLNFKLALASRLYFSRERVKEMYVRSILHNFKKLSYNLNDITMGLISNIKFQFFVFAKQKKRNILIK